MQKQHVIFLVKPFSSTEDALQELEALSLSHPYVVENREDNTFHIGGWMDPENLPLAFHHIERMEIDAKEEIDWEQQWEDFSPSFYDGICHIDLSSYHKDCRELLLQPGRGFGDLSHPTTRLCMQLMVPFLQGAHVIDMGCGSGILTLASLRMGAITALGIDIDRQSLTHAQCNAVLNDLDTVAFFDLKIPEQKIFMLKSPLVILMNMLLWEQCQAWNSHPALHPHEAVVITSGILLEHKERYLEWTCQRGWKLLHTEEEEHWLGCVFHQEKSSNRKGDERRGDLSFFSPSLR